MKKSLRIHNIEAAPGAKVFGFVEVVQRPISPAGFPLQIVNGLQEGPILLIIAGTHACEYAGIDAAIQISNQTVPANLRGALICIPVVNTAAFEAQTPYVCPIDGLNISDLFPADMNGTASHKIAHFLFNEIALKANYILDLHGGDLPEDLSPYSIFSRSGNEEADVKSEQMARYYGAPIIDEVSHPASLIHQSSLNGIPGIICESGGLGRLLEEDVAVHVRGVRNIMAYLGMSDAKPEPPPEGQRVFKSKKIRLGVSKGGILRLHVKVGQSVEADQLLGEVVNLQGDKVEELRSPTRAVVRILIPKYVVTSGDKVVFLSQIEK